MIDTRFLVELMVSTGFNVEPAEILQNFLLSKRPP
jgi:hypothetical protein